VTNGHEAVAAVRHGGDLILMDIEMPEMGALKPCASSGHLERLPVSLNRRGFPNRTDSDSNCVLAKEAGAHGETAVSRSS
jgi:DNA-binding NarL/FixJ family response regulator